MNASVALTPELLTQLTAIVGENRIKTDAWQIMVRSSLALTK